MNQSLTGGRVVSQALARYVPLPQGCALMLGNGSDELISLIAMACDVPGASILAPLPGFVMYAMSAQLQGLKFIGNVPAEGRAPGGLLRHKGWKAASVDLPKVNASVNLNIIAPAEIEVE